MKKRLQLKTTLFSWMSAMTAVFNLAPSKASFCRFDIRRASTPPATASAHLRLSFVMRYTVRMGIQNWMVWDSKTHRPVKLSKNEASELAAALNTLPQMVLHFTPRSLRLRSNGSGAAAR